MQNHANNAFVYLDVNEITRKNKPTALVATHFCAFVVAVVWIGFPRGTSMGDAYLGSGRCLTYVCDPAGGAKLHT
jgi:hypothetical protein